jgi:hypothetical protein
LLFFFFFFKFGGRGFLFIFSFFSGSQCVPTMFPLSILDYNWVISPGWKWWQTRKLWVHPLQNNRMRGKGVFCFFFVWGGGVKSKSSQVSDMFSKEFPIAPHSYMLWQMLSSFHIYRCAKGEKIHTSE